MSQVLMSLGSECPQSPFRAIPVKLESKAAEAGYSHYPFVELQHAPAAALGLASYRPRARLWLSQNLALNFDDVARGHVFCSPWRPELRAPRTSTDTKKVDPVAMPGFNLAFVKLVNSDETT